MQLDQPAVISECDGCGGKHQSAEQWVSCLIDRLERTRSALRKALLDPDRLRGKKIRELVEQHHALPRTSGGSFDEMRRADRKRR